MWARTTTLSALLASAAAISCHDSPTATLGINVGLETDAFTRAPAPTELIVNSVGLDGTVIELSRTALPADTISLGDKQLTDVAEIGVLAIDATGKPLLKGQSLYIQLGSLQTQDVSVFVQRVGETARLPNVTQQLDAPQVQVGAGRYLLGASGTTTTFYDLLLLSEAVGFPTLKRPAQSLATFGTAGIIIDDKGATTLDLSDGSQTDLNTPAGGTFAEVAGGDSIVNLLDESVFVVGGTRTTGDASLRVFNVTQAGDVSFLSFTTARKGACATYVPGRGLFVYGGAGTDSSAELIAPTSTVGTKLAFPADPVVGCAATALDNAHVLVVGGVGTAQDPNAMAPARVIDVSCASNCVPAPWMGTTPLVRADAVTIATGVGLVLGDDASGNSHLYRQTVDASVEVPLKVARRGARLVLLPNPGQAAIVGGAPSIEQYLE